MMADEIKRWDTLESFVENISAVAIEHFATGEVDTPVLHFPKDNAIGVAHLWPLPGLDLSHMARLIIGYYDPPLAVVLAEGWATNMALPKEVEEAMAGKRPWGEVRERIHKRVAPALRHYPMLSEPLKRGDVEALGTQYRQALTYAWHDETMGPVVRDGKSLKDLPTHMRRKIMTLFGEDRQGHSRTLMWRIEQRDGRRHFVQEVLEEVDGYASRWRPLYFSWEMAAKTGQPMAVIRAHVRELCRKELAPYRLVEGIDFADAASYFGKPMPPYMQ